MAQGWDRERPAKADRGWSPWPRVLVVVAVLGVAVWFVIASV